MGVCPSVHIEQIDSYCTDFNDILYLSTCRKSVDKFLLLLLLPFLLLLLLLLLQEGDIRLFSFAAVQFRVFL